MPVLLNVQKKVLTQLGEIEAYIRVKENTLDFYQLKSKWEGSMECRGLLGGSPANLGNNHGFISENTISIGMRPFGKLEAEPRELMLKVDNIISLWRVVIPSMDKAYI